MYNKYFALIHNALKRHKWLVIAAVGIATLIAGINLRFVPFENNIETMLPGNEYIHRSMQFLRGSNFSDKVVLSFNLESAGYTTQDLIQAVDQFSASLDLPLITRIRSGIPEIGVMDEMLLFSKYAPQLFDEETLSQTVRQITPDSIQARLKQLYRQLLSPASTFMKPLIQADPLGISLSMLREVEKLSSSLGYEVMIEQDHFISRDGKHAMFIIETTVPLTDGFGSRKLISYLKKQLAGLPDYISCDIIAGHLHTISNEDVIKKDIRRMLFIASGVFFLLFLFAFRNLKAITIFLMPLASIIISINLTHLVFKELSYFIIGMGAVIIGIAIDYGIHIYVAMRTSGGHPDVLKRVAKPVLIGALTTIGVFTAFLFSSVSGYRQLGLFSILSLIICLIYALFILPYFLGSKESKNIIYKIGQNRSNWRRIHSSVICLVWAALICTAIILSGRLVFNNDIQQFDGSSREVVQAEEKFRRIWGGNDQAAIMVASGETLEDASRLNENIYNQAVKDIGKDKISSIARVWPSKQSRIANLARWKNFWRQGQMEKLKNLFREYGSSYGFTEDAFNPFFDNIYADIDVEDTPVGLASIEGLKERFVQKNQNEYHILSFFPDEKQYLDSLSTISEDRPEVFLISRKALSQNISQSISSEAIFILRVAILFILALAFLLLRNIGLAFMALIPVFSAVLSISGIYSFLGIPLNVPTLVSAIIVVGLSIDYGIFMLYKYRNDIDLGTSKAVFLSAVTTLTGAGVLLFSQHPVLFYIGLTLVIGVTSGYIASVVVVPSIYTLWKQRKKGCLQP